MECFVIRTAENRMKIGSLVMFVLGFVNGPDFGEISIAYPGFRSPYWISGATQDKNFRGVL